MRTEPELQPPDHLVPLAADQLDERAVPPLARAGFGPVGRPVRGRCGGGQGQRGWVRVGVAGTQVAV